MLVLCVVRCVVAPQLVVARRARTAVGLRGGVVVVFSPEGCSVGTREKVGGRPFAAFATLVNAHTHTYARALYFVLSMYCVFLWSVRCLFNHIGFFRLFRQMY